MDALGKAEDETKKQEKSLEKTICKSLKSVYPDMKLPKTDGGLQKFFEEFQTSCTQYTNERESSTKSQIETLKSANEDLQRQLEELNNNRKSVCLLLFKYLKNHKIFSTCMTRLIHDCYRNYHFTETNIFDDIVDHFFVDLIHYQDHSFIK